ncbi:MAG: hypothetical protein OEV64_00145, partial [Desulfobulbaceae bacterium]|nr:hypothetical protein [Desulfobulbaceae bacterium]
MRTDQLIAYTTSHQSELESLLQRYVTKGKNLFLRSDIWDEFKLFTDTDNGRILKNGPFTELFAKTQEAALINGCLYLAVRPRVASWRYFKLKLEKPALEPITIISYMEIKERLINPKSNEWPLEIDLGPF